MPINPLPRSIAPALLVAVAGCGGGTTGPDAPPVAGLYRVHETVAAVSCTPQRPPSPGGEVILEAFAADYSLRLAVSGGRVTATDPAFPLDVDTGTVRTGAVSFGRVIEFREEPRAGNRVFHVQLTRRLELQPTSGGLRGSGSYVNVFREGAAAAPVFATCSRTSAVELTRVGG
jgi:hypothetical protein